ncbi:MAG: hypothetical protein F2961_06315 [Actinobacteria bacterium]|uniref:Unannotated protein n=1 Tax=freshwater metagenome TaxID=449393 RepID=A0A6J7W8R6_9ZZZZ|nr:hypothetical protein [Actinomycetota bacterium]
MNIRFKYLYRDAGNFKNWGELVFSNPHNINVNLVKALAENVLIDQAYFIASKANVPDLHFNEYNDQLDHSWHQFHMVAQTEEATNDSLGRNIEEFIESLQFAASE